MAGLKTYTSHHPTTVNQGARLVWKWQPLGDVDDGEERVGRGNEFVLWLKCLRVSDVEKQTNGRHRPLRSQKEETLSPSRVSSHPRLYLHLDSPAALSLWLTFTATYHIPSRQHIQASRTYQYHSPCRGSWRHGHLPRASHAWSRYSCGR